MKNDGRKKILIILIVLLVVSSIIAIILSFYNENDNSQNNNSNNITLTTEITSLKSNAEYFGVQNILNEFYNNLAKKNNLELYNVLDKEYINDNNITESNVTNKIYSDYETVTFMAKNIYYNANSDITYYFINGYVYTSTMAEDNYTYEENVNYLVIVDQNSNYTIKPLSENINIYNYAANYELVEKDFNNNTKFKNITLSDKNKLTLYINEFLNLLFYDTNRAYNMLDEDTKSKYLNYTDFQNQINNIYNSISSNIFSYSKIENENNIEYRIKDNQQRNIKIIENKTMDYLIGY